MPEDYRFESILRLLELHTTDIEWLRSPLSDDEVARIYAVASKLGARGRRPSQSQRMRFAVAALRALDIKWDREDKGTKP